MCVRILAVYFGIFISKRTFKFPNFYVFSTQFCFFYSFYFRNAYKCANHAIRKIFVDFFPTWCDIPKIHFFSRLLFLWCVISNVNFFLSVRIAQSHAYTIFGLHIERQTTATTTKNLFEVRAIEFLHFYFTFQPIKKSIFSLS